MLNIKTYPELIIEFLIKELEGIDISDDHSDRGGITKFGISKKAYPDVDIENLSYNEAFFIYLNDYWAKNKCDLIIEKNIKAAVFTFINSVNFGNKTAAEILQDSINNCRANVIVDGIIGQKTINAISTIETDFLISNIILETSKKYAEISHLHKNVNFLNGWFNRIKKILFFLY